MKAILIGVNKWNRDAFRVGKKAAGRMLDGREWMEFPEVKK
jgi:protein gp37